MSNVWYVTESVHTVRYEIVSRTCTLSLAVARMELQATEAFLQRIPDAIIQEVKFTCEEPLDLACRFLRARKFSVDDAERMILDTKICDWHGTYGLVWLQRVWLGRTLVIATIRAAIPAATAATTTITIINTCYAYLPALLPLPPMTSLA